MPSTLRVLALCFVFSAVPVGSAPLRVMGFGGSSNWALFVAQDEGFFGREGLEVSIAAARDSADQMQRLMDGRLDVALTAFDNVVAYHDRQASTGRDRDVVAVFGVNHGGRSTLYAQPSFASIAALRDARIGVDAVSTGYAFVVEAMLERGGLAAGDYSLVSIGGSRDRWEALRDKRVDATLLNAPFDATAEAAGFRRLLVSDEAVGRYQGSVGAVRRSWARANAQAVVRFIRGYVAATDWLVLPQNAARAQQILRAHVARLDPAQAQRSYADLLDPRDGSLSRRAAFDVEGARGVLALREAHARPHRALGPVERYYDRSYYRRALEVPR